MTIRSGDIASRLRAVSSSVSPFVTDESVEHDLDYLALFRRDELADEVRLNRKLPVLLPAVDQDGELHAPWPAEVNELVERRAYGAARVEHVVDQKYVAPFDVRRQ